ncbi:proton channel OTOP2-like [Lissotriton helveticus]
MESVTELELDWTVLPDQQGAPALQQNHSSEPHHFALWKKGGRLFSSLVAVNILLFGCCLITACSLEKVAVDELEVLVFLSSLMLLSVLWMCVQMYLTKHQDAILFKDHHAGPIWLRGGLLLFGLCTLALDGFKIAIQIENNNSRPTLMIIFPVIQAVFVIVQTYFLWVSSRHCVQIHLNVTRCGLMLVLTTNLAVWMATITDESSHLTREMMEALNYTKVEDCPEDSMEDKTVENSDHTCNSSCILLKTVYYYLFPFSLEFSLFACAMTYVMWKNVGRLMDDHLHYPHHLKRRSFRHIPFVGLTCGFVMTILGVCLFVVYEVRRKDEQERNFLLTVVFIFNVVCLSLMTLAALGGIIVFKFDRRKLDTGKNPSRALDVVLLLLATLGQYCISYYSILAMVVSKPTDHMKVLTLMYSLLMIIQHTIQNIFIIEGLHRQVPKDWESQHKTSPQPQINDFSRLETVSRHSFLHAPRTESQRVEAPTVRSSLSPPVSTHRKRRRLLREICAFLLLGNILLWILPAFGARLLIDNNLELKFYGMHTWIIIINICLPFGIFYRMHAAACMLELSLHTLKEFSLIV